MCVALFHIHCAATAHGMEVRRLLSTHVCHLHSRVSMCMHVCVCVCQCAHRQRSRRCQHTAYRIPLRIRAEQQNIPASDARASVKPAHSTGTAQPNTSKTEKRYDEAEELKTQHTHTKLTVVPCAYFAHMLCSEKRACTAKTRPTDRPTDPLRSSAAVPQDEQYVYVG